MKKNILMVFTGTGKGKTTAAFGQALRYLGAGKKVLVVQFFKPGNSSEIAILKKLKVKIISDHQARIPVDLKDEETIKRQLRLLKQALAESQNYNVFILDEFNYLASSPLTNRYELKKYLNSFLSYGDTLATGRNAPLWLVRMADMVSKIVEVKHHFRSGIEAEKGREF